MPASTIKDPRLSPDAARHRVAGALALAGLLAAAPADPVRAADLGTVAVIGDSLGVGIQNGLYHVVPKTMRLVRASRHNTGLTRSEIYDWPAQVEGLVKRHRVDTLIVFLGANDYQRIILRTRKGIQLLRAGRPGWIDAYRTRAATLVQGARKGGAKRIVWVGLPIVRSDEQDRRYRLLNQIYRSVAASDAAVTYFPTRVLSAARTPAGQLVYRAYISVGGKRYLFRNTKDGIHFTVYGYRYLARHLWQAITRADQDQ